MAKEFLTNIIIGGKVSPTLAKAINKANEQNKILKKIGNTGKAIGKATLAASTAAAAGIVAVTKSAVDSYAEYEQLVGGSQLMFGDAYSYIADKAKTAYKDVQMSQNEYLQQVNGFATGLKTSLKGNAQAAAELAHKIVVAEADVVAATGNSAENVQNAFNGIMKSNYTMLDNLQLGITPTKQGFQDLITKVNKWNAQNGKMTKYTINNLADCQSALVDYIEMQGLAGYASNEASGTIQGSVAMAKAAWSNLVTGLADENADFDTLLTNFLDSVGKVAENLLPKVSVIIGKIPDMVRGLMPMIPPLVAELLPVAIEGVSSIISGVGAILPELVSTVVSSIGQIISKSFEQMPTPMLIIAGAIAAITAGIAAYNAVVAIKNIIDKVQEKGVKKLVAAQIAQNAAFLASPIFWIIAGIVALVAAFVILWNKCEGFRNFFINMWNGIKTAFGVVVNWIKENWQTMLLFLINPLAGVFKYCYEHFEGFRNMVNNVIASVISFFVGLWGKIKSMFTAVAVAISNGVVGAFKSVINTVIGFAERIINGFFNSINGAIGFINKIPGVNIPLIATLSIPRLATGGSFDGTHPQLAVVGDAPETMVPHGNTPRNRALLAEAARGVGGGAFGNVNVTFAPVIYGGGSDVRQAIRDSEIEFEQRMRAFMRKEGLVSYA